MLTKTDVFSFMSIGGTQMLVGSAADPDIKYFADYDLMETAYFKKGSYNYILDLFRSKYKSAYKTEGLWITDFKCGSFRGQPLRWDKDSINLGYIIIEDTHIYFVDCLQMTSRIKLDVIANVDSRLTEFSDIYFIKIADTFISPVLDLTETLKSLYADFLNFKQFNLFKAIKRLYSFFKLKKDPVRLKIIRDLLNSDLGDEYIEISKLQTKLLLNEQLFKRVPVKFKSNTIKLNLKINNKIDTLNRLVIDYIKENNLNFHFV